MHVTLGHLCQKVIQSSEYGVIIYTRLELKHRFHLICDAFGAVRTYQNTEVGHSYGLQGIKLLMKSFPVSTASFRSNQRAIPEVGSDERQRVFPTDELAVLDPYKFRRPLAAH